MSEWQPIETAPKDRFILVAPGIYTGLLCGIAIWDDDDYEKNPRPFWRRLEGPNARYSRSRQPTHWMSLPEPPK